MSLKVLSLLFIWSLVGAGAQDFYCPGQTVEFTCIDTSLVKWQGSALTAGQCPGGTISFLTGDLDQSDVGNSTTCGIFTATILSLEPGSVQGLFVVNVSLSFTATLSLNGLTVQCEDGAPGEPYEVDVVLTVPETTTPTISVDQVSQESVNVNFVLDDNRCVSSYNVNATEADDNTTTASHSGVMSPVTVTGLDICQNNYSFMGYVTTENGEQSNVSMPVDFMIDFTVINPVTVTVSSPPQEPILSWVHEVTPQYLTCITEFLVTSDVDNNTFNTTVGSEVRSLTTQQLNNAGFEYCVPLRPVVTPITGMGPLALRSAMGSGMQDTYLLDPDFPTPMLSYSFSLTLANETLNETEDTVVLTVTIQSVSNTTVPMRTFEYNIDAGQLSNATTFTGDYFEIDLGGAQGGEVVGVTVNFQDRECRTTASADYTVPMRNISDVQLGVAANVSQTVTITLPVTPQEPSDLDIISTIVPADSGPYMDSYPGHGSQYTVMFTDLNPDTEYMYTIRIVVRADDTEVAATTGAFMTLPTPTTEAPTTTEPTTTPTEPPPTPAPSACDTGCIIGIIIAVIAIVLIIIVIIIVLLVIRSKKRSGSMKVTSHEMEQQHKLTGTNGDEPGSPVKDEPATSGTFKTDGTSPGDQADSGNGATGGEGGDAAALIYADLDIAKKSKPKDPDTPTGAAATGGEESVHYATIDHLKKDEGTEGEGTS